MHLKAYCIIIYCLNFLWKPVSTLITKTNEIHDLVSTIPSEFAADAAQWTAEGNVTSTLHTTCGTTLLLGGHGILGKHGYFKRTYTNLTEHGGISGQISFWLIDNWRDYDDMIFFRVYDEVSTNIYYNRILGVDYDVATWGSSDCGSAHADLKNVKFNFRFPHSSDTVTFQIFTTHPMDNNPSSFGIRDVKLLLHRDNQSPAAFCGRPPGSSVLLAVGTSYPWTCDCPDGTFGWLCPNLCSASYSEVCYDANNPIICLPGAALKATSPTNCRCRPCHSSCLTCSDPEADNKCLSCHIGSFLYRNGSCLTDCPYTQMTLPSGIEYCSFTCPSLAYEEYLYPDGDCKPACDRPFVIRDVLIGAHCDFPCAPNGFAFPDFECRSACEAPMRQKIEPFDIKYCITPCDGSMYYYPQEKICRSTCPYPREIKQSQFYVYCDTGSGFNLAFATASSLMNSQAGEVINKGALAGSFILVGQSFGIMVASQTRMFQNLRYVNISFATHTELMIKNWGANLMTLEFFPSPPDSVVEQLPKNVVIEIFERYNIHPSFLVSSWRSVLSILALLALTLIFRIIEWAMSSPDKVTSTLLFIQYLRFLAQNSFIITLYGNFGYIVLYAILEYRSLSLTPGSLPIVSFVLSIFFLIVVLVTLILHIIILRIRRKLLSKADWSDDMTPLKNFAKRNAGSRVLVHDFKDKFQSYLFLFMIRDVICNLIVTTLTNFPLHQTGAMTVFSVIWVFYIYSNRPFKRFLDLVQNLFCEVLLLVANFSTFVVSVLDDIENDSVEIREHLGKAVIISTTIFGFSIFGFFGLKAGMMIYDYFKLRKAMQASPANDAGILQQNFLGNLLGLNDEIIEAEVEKDVLENKSKRSNPPPLPKPEKAKTKRVKKERNYEVDTIDEHYRKKDLVLDNRNLRVHVGRFGKWDATEPKEHREHREHKEYKEPKEPKEHRDTTSEMKPKKSQKKDNHNSSDGMQSVGKRDRDARKNMTDFKPSENLISNPSHPSNAMLKVPETTDLRCKERDQFMGADLSSSPYPNRNLVKY